MNANGFTILIDQAIVGNFHTRLRSGNVSSRGGRSLRALLGDDDIFEPRPSAVNNQRRGNLIAGRNFVRRLKHPRRRFAHREWHCHAGHVIFDVFVSDRKEVVVFLNYHDLALEFVLLLSC